MTLLDMSLMGTVMILVICAMRAGVRERLPRRTFVALWLLAVVRLILPWKVPSPVSVYRLLDAPASHSTPQTVQFAGSAVRLPAAAAGTATLQAAQIQTPAQDPWTVIWWVGCILCAGIVTALYVRWRRRFAESLPVNAAVVRAFVEQHPLRRHFVVRSTSYIGTPMTYGVIRPVILLPASMDLTDEKQIEYILAHEYVHIRNFDVLLKLLFIAVCCVHWFNPLVWVMFVLAARDMELACDESVVAQCGGRADYARTLIQLESRKSGYIVPGMGCSAGAVKERIRSIMKHKKKSLLTLVVAGALVAGVGTAFATSAPEPPADGAWSLTTQADAVAIEDEAADAAYVDDGIEWWTPEGYAAWLENEKTSLQSIIGSKCWTPSEGEFEWTQERVDKTIACYEQILEDIKRGAVRVSKSVDGYDNVVITQSTASEESAGTDYVDPELFKVYAGFGLTIGQDGAEYQGEKVRYFEDSVDIEPGITASKVTYYTDDGTAFIRTVRRPTRNSDGSTDPFGQLIRIERIPENEAAAILKGFTEADVSVTAVEDEITSDDLAPYQAFGLEYEEVPDGFRMRCDGKPVHSLFDPMTGTWFASNMHGFDLGEDRIDLEAVYTDGKLSGLKAVPEQHSEETTQTGYVAASVEEGRSFDEIFRSYEPYGLSFRHAASPNGGTGYNLYLEGKPVNHFADIAPGGSAFSFESAEQVPGGISARVVYDEDVPVRVESV